MRIARTKTFIKDYKKLTSELQERFIKQLELFKKDIKHPSLGVKKIKGTGGIFEGRVSRSCRFTFHTEEDVVMFRRIGDHDKTLKNP